MLGPQALPSRDERFGGTFVAPEDVGKFRLLWLHTNLLRNLPGTRYIRHNAPPLNSPAFVTLFLMRRGCHRKSQPPQDARPL